ncbi:chorismate mutase [Haematospirillum sp. H1815]|uniref:chorismate mutase n=1 Tax=Haematospirillum sp. H1815 TaxID=2723108 RepID=UPI00143A24E3|nr:chorismate mutase [Haematospirillum sp. H1815]NKD76885.1 chorismate mutase [Haematospirillum sp. H1815]
MPESNTTLALPTLGALRERIDAIDNQVLDLVLERSHIVSTVGDVKRAAGESVGIFLRPGREMQILRRLVKRAEGAKFRRSVIVRIWRELFAAMVALEGSLSMAVFTPVRGSGYLELGRDSYGTYTRTIPSQSAGSVVRMVADGDVVVGIVPLPGPDDRERWWPHLLSDQPDTPSIVARVPFAGPGTGRGDGLEGLVICRLPQENTGDDRTYVTLETDDSLSRSGVGELVAQVGLTVVEVPDSIDAGPDTRIHLVELEGCILADDPRLQSVLTLPQVRKFRVVGGYAVPFPPGYLD